MVATRRRMTAARWKRMMASRMINMAALPWGSLVGWLSGRAVWGLLAGAAAVCDCHRPTVKLGKGKYRCLAIC